MSNVRKCTADRKLCVSCGICKPVCPHHAIEYVQEDGIYVPTVNEKCTECGLCVRVCPGVTSDYLALYDMVQEKMPENLFVGNVKGCYVAKAKESKLLATATSGGIVTALIKECLDKSYYDSAFCVDTYAYDSQVVTARYTAGDELTRTQKSRYIPVSHEKLIEHMRNHPEERIIIVAVSCAMQGIVKAMELYKLNRANYLLIGLFCDKTMSYHIYDYLQQKTQEKVAGICFRDKEAGGWPGNISLITKQGNKIELPAKERMKVKQFFQMERCLYCIDKLNQLADIAVGDNYTGIEKTTLGSSSVIVRTTTGEKMWNACETLFDTTEVNITDITKGQHIENRTENLKMSVNYSEKTGHQINKIPAHNQQPLEQKLYQKRLDYIAMGRMYLQSPDKLEKELHKKEQEKHRKDTIIRIRTVLGKIKRKIGFR
ncbi:MAG: Coenzyme F420 hydrogenase/dehydrogenase, beta subunit C-terminal domain [Lachnospiraceae bacterium]|nr:Coenzyme F420 hydrogenase/dehydrogenase, beta subunit C-terminal domain [Lachnospiraceae bacterium]